METAGSTLQETGLPEEEGEETDTGGISPEKREFTVKIPGSACRQDLVDLKTYLESIPEGAVRISIDVQGQIRDTKISIGSIRAVEEWMETRQWQK